MDYSEKSKGNKKANPIGNIISKFVFTEELPFEARIINMVFLIGALASVTFLLLRLLVGADPILLGIIGIIIVAIFSMFYLCNKMRVFKFFSWLIVILLCDVLIPTAFFFMGGTTGSIPAFFVLTIVVIFLVIRGKGRYVVLFTHFIVIVTVYLISYFNPELAPPSTGLAQLEDHIASSILVGCCIGAFITAQHSMFISEQQKVNLSNKKLQTAQEELLSQQEVLDRRLHQQAIVADITRSFLTDASMDQQITKALGLIAQSMNVTRALISITDPVTDESHIQYTWFKSEEWIPRESTSGFNEIIQTSFPKETPETGSYPTIYIENTHDDEDGYYRIFEKVGLKSFIWAPIYVKDHFWGLLSIEECEYYRKWLEGEEMLVSAASGAIAGAVSRDLIDKERIDALDTALKASQAKGDFLSNMSHEMRTPMNAIIGMTSIGKNSDDLERKDYALTKVEEASTHLLGVINDILDMSKIEADKLELSPTSFNFEKMLRKVVNVISFKVEERNQTFNVTIDKNIPTTAIGDEQRLAQVITNLLGNAVKFTPENGQIRLDSQLIESDGDDIRLKIEVTDTGIGISEEQQSRLFSSFEQAESGTSRKYGGTGLGLAISKRIVEMMNGEIWIESELKNGSTFAFTVLLKRDNEKNGGMLREDIEWSNIKTLVVDDDPETLLYFEELFERFGISCDVASNGEAALELLDSNGPYDIYFIDWKMPDMNGMELSRKIKSNGNSGEKSVITMISSTEWSYIADDARGAGVDLYLPKPLFPSAIAELINECIGEDRINLREEASDDTDIFKGHRILLAEDIDINREIVLELLADTEIDIDVAVNGKIALEMFEADPSKYEVIFMDVQMPEMDGLEATRSIRKLSIPQASKIPIVAMTANVFREDIERCLEAGMNDHIGKPIDYNDVIVKLRKYLKVNSTETKKENRFIKSSLDGQKTSIMHYENDEGKA